MKKYIAEFIGTAVLVVFGCGTAMLVGCDAASGSGYLLTALAFGLAIVAEAYCIGNITFTASVGSYNPGDTIVELKCNFVCKGFKPLHLNAF